MKKFIPLSVLSLLLISTTLFAQENSKSIGVNFIGSEISADFTLSEKSSIRLDLDFTFIDINQVLLSPSYLMYITDKTTELDGNATFTPYHGPGIILGYGFDPFYTAVGAQYIFGFDVDVTNAPITFFMDAGPYLLLSDDELSLFGISSSFGFRYRL